MMAYRLTIVVAALLDSIVAIQLDNFRSIEAEGPRDSRRDSPNVLYIDQLIPQQNFGGGFNRAYDNLIAISSLGYRLTATAVEEAPDDMGFGDVDKGKLEQQGVEIVMPKVGRGTGECNSARELLESRPNFYSAVIVSRVPTFDKCEDLIMKHCRNKNCGVIFDAEALWFRRDEMFIKVAEEGLISSSSQKLVKHVTEGIAAQRQNELRKVGLADVIITVSEEEKKYINNIVPPVGEAIVVGHVMSTEFQTVTPYDDRNGILFVGRFGHSMYYNGDSLWWFLENVYPTILKEERIPLTIAGRGIPQDLRDLSSHLGVGSLVTFLESPADLKPLYETARMTIMPHQYAAGIQFKLSEAMAAGVPSVVSKVAAAGFGFDVGDVGADQAGRPRPPFRIGLTSQDFARGVLTIHRDETQWNDYRQRGIKYIDTTHKESQVRSALQTALKKAIP